MRRMRECETTLMPSAFIDEANAVVSAPFETKITDLKTIWRMAHDKTEPAMMAAYVVTGCDANPTSPRWKPKNDEEDPEQSSRKTPVAITSPHTPERICSKHFDRSCSALALPTPGLSSCPSSSGAMLPFRLIGLCTPSRMAESG